MPVSESLIRQYIQCREISEDFASYYQFYQKCREKYRADMENIFTGDAVVYGQEEWPLDEQLTISNLLISQVLNHIAKWNKSAILMQRLEQVGQLLERQIRVDEKNVYEALEVFFQKRAYALGIKEQT